MLNENIHREKERWPYVRNDTGNIHREKWWTSVRNDRGCGIGSSKIQDILFYTY